MQNLLVGSRCPSFLFFLYVVFRAPSFAYISPPPPPHPPTTFIKNIAAAATIFELSTVGYLPGESPISSCRINKTDVIPTSNTDHVLLICFTTYLLSNIGAKSSLKANRESAERGAG